MRGRVVLRVVLAMVFVLLVMQLVPYGWQHSNPPVTQAAEWSDPEAEALARGACYDCHSNETDWPTYSYVAPVSWLVRRDVDRGRAAMNLSELDQDGGDELDEAAEQLAEDAMPPLQYRLAHPDARLSETEREQLMVAYDELAARVEDGGGGDEDNSGPGNVDDS